MKNALIGLVIGGLLALGGVVLGQHYFVTKQAAPLAGGTSFTPVEGIPYTVAKTVLPTDSTITLSSFTTPDGRNLTMANFGTIGYGTLDPNNLSRLESVTFSGISNNANGTVTLTGVTRGNDFISPYAASTTLAQLHLVGSSFIVSNTAGFYGQQFLFANSISTSTVGIVMSSTSPPYYDADPVWANFSTQILADVSYVNSVVAAGAANASETVKGIIQLATGAQAALGTSAGSTGARLVVPNSLATSTPYSGTPQGSFPTSNATGGKISQLWLDLTQSFTFLNFIQAPTSTIGSLNVGSINATSSIKINGVPVLTSVVVPRYSVSQTGLTVTNGYATSTVINVPAGALNASSTISLFGNATCGTGGSAGSCTYYVRTSSGATFFSCAPSISTSNTYNEQIQATVTNTYVVNSQTSVYNCSAENTTPASTILANGSGTSAIDLSQALGIVVVVQGPAANVTPTLNFSLVVNP